MRSVEELEEELRSGRREEAKRKAEKYLEEQFGIEWEELNFPENELSMGFARQIPTSNFEIIAGILLAELCGFGEETLSFISDLFTSTSPLKVSYVKLKWLKNGGVVGERIARPREGEVLWAIWTHNGKSLPQYHLHLYKEVCGGSVTDLSMVFSRALGYSLLHGYRHQRIWVTERMDGTYISFPYRWDERKERYVPKKYRSMKTVEDVIELAFKGFARPDASWYYKHLFLFIPGILRRFILLVTPWEEDDEKIRRLAEEAYEFVRKVTGVFPLTAAVPNIGNLKEAKIFGKRPEYTLLDEVPDINIKVGNFYETSKMIVRELVKNVRAYKKA